MTHCYVLNLSSADNTLSEAAGSLGDTPHTHIHTQTKRQKFKKWDGRIPTCDSAGECVYVTVSVFPTFMNLELLAHAPICLLHCRHSCYSHFLLQRVCMTTCVWMTSSGKQWLLCLSPDLSPPLSAPSTCQSVHTWLWCGCFLCVRGWERERE